ncbi:MAG: A24 family peptidase [Lachnospiraceae bacterium]
MAAINVWNVLFVITLCVASVQDIKTHTLSDNIHIAILILGLFKGSILVSLIGLLVTGMPLFFTAMLSKGKIGGGDVKLMGAIGFYLGASRGMNALIMGLFLIVFYGYVIKNRKQKDEPLALAPFLGMGSVMALFI